MAGMPIVSLLEERNVSDVVFSPDHKRLYVSLADGTLEVFDLATQAKLHSWKVGTALGAISVAEDESFILAVDPQKPVLLRVSATTGEVATSYPSNGGPFVDVEIVDARTAVVTGGQSSSSFGGAPVTLDLVTGRTTAIANGSSYSANSVLAEDEHLTLFAETGISNGPLAIFDDRTGRIVARGDSYQSTTTGFNFGIQAISEKAGLVLQFIYYSSVNVYDLSLKFQRTVNLGRNADGIAFDETGRYVFVHHLGDANGTSSLSKYDAASWTEIERIPLTESSSWGSNQGLRGNQLQITDDGRYVTIQDMSGKLQLVDLSATDDVLTGTASTDRLFGGGGADVIRGEGGNDVLGSAGMLIDANGRSVPGIDVGTERDQLFGGDGDDLIGAGWGDDVDGGAGTDSLRLSLDGATVGVTLSTGDFADGKAATIGGGTIRNVETLALLRGSDFADTITVAAPSAAQTVAPVIDGGRGDDVVIATSGPVDFRGGAGNDLFVNGSGLDTIDGGEGDDIVDYRNATIGIELRLAAAPGTVTVGPGGDTIVNVESINGSSFDDVLIGSNGANRLNGGGGNDRIDGGAGNDVLNGDAGDDTLTGGAGDDRIDGGVGIDLAQFVGAADQTFVAFGADGGVTITGPDGRDTLLNVERLQAGDVTVAISAAAPVGVTYRQWGGRDANIAELGYWTAEIAAGRTTEAGVKAAILADPLGQTYVAARVTALYQAYGGRLPGDGEIAIWKGLIAGGATFDTVRSAILADPLGTTAAGVIGTYESFGGRAPAEGELVVWQRLIRNGATLNDVKLAVIDDQLGQTYLPRAIDELYQVYGGRAAQAGEIATWKGLIRAGADLVTVRNAILDDPLGATHTTKVLGELYGEYFGRAPSAGEREAWNGLFHAGATPDAARATLMSDGGSAGRVVQLTGSAGADTFVFAPSERHVAITRFDPTLDHLVLGQAFAGIDPLDAAHAREISTLGGGTDVYIALDATHDVLIHDMTLARLTAGDFVL